MKSALTDSEAINGTKPPGPESHFRGAVRVRVYL